MSELFPSDHIFAGLKQNHYSTIACDPPWRFNTWSEKNQLKAAANHYSVMTLEDIESLPVADLAADDCALFMWAINPMLPQALEVMEAWGFEFKTVGFTWAKTTRKSQKWHMGLGYWTRANSEFCLFGTRGKPKRIAKDVRQLIVEPIREHSRKPDSFRESVQRLCPGPYVELFARSSARGWDSWGNEAQKFDTPKLERDAA